MEPIKIIEKGKYEIKIYQDMHPEDPRDGHNMGKMFCFHTRYNLGDEHEIKEERFKSWKQIREYLEELNYSIIIPIYLYDHSGLRMQTRPFHSRWDSGQIGFICCRDEDIVNCFGTNKVTNEDRDKAEKALLKEVEIYDNYISGNVYGYKAIKKVKVTVKKTYEDGSEKIYDTEEEIDVGSCWGFYDEDSLREHAEDDIEADKNN